MTLIEYLRAQPDGQQWADLLNVKLTCLTDCVEKAYNAADLHDIPACKHACDRAFALLEDLESDGGQRGDSVYV